MSVLFLGALLCLVLPVATFGEEGEPDSAKPRTVIKQTKYANVKDLQEILGMLGIQIRLQPSVNAIVLRGDVDKIETALQLIEHLDVPPQPEQNVEVSAFVVSASKDGDGGTGIPDGLESTVDQLGKIFGYKHFELLDTVFLRVRRGQKGRLEGGISFAEGHETGYQLTFKRVDVIPQEENRRIIRLDGLTFELNGAHEGQVQRAFLQTDVEVREGQKAVVGKSTPRGTGATLILIVEAKVLE